MKDLDQELLQIEPTSYALFRYDVLNQPKLNMWPKEQLDEVIELVMKPHDAYHGNGYTRE